MARWLSLLFLLLHLLSAEENSSYEKGLSLLAEGLPELAIESFQQSLELKEKEPTLARVRLIEAYLQTKLISKAKVEIKALPEGFPDKDYWNGMTALLSGEYKKAERAFLAHLRNNSDSLKTALNLTITYANQGRYAEGVTTLQPFLEQSEKANSLYLQLLLQEKNNEAFLDHLKEIENNFPLIFQSYLGVAHYLRGEYLEAKESFQSNPLSYLRGSNRILKRFECMTFLELKESPLALEIIKKLIETSIDESELSTIFDLYLIASNSSESSSQLISDQLISLSKSPDRLHAGYASFYLSSLATSGEAREEQLQKFIIQFPQHPLYAQAALLLAKRYYAENEIERLRELSDVISLNADHRNLLSLIQNWIGITLQGEDGSKALNKALKYASTEQAPFIRFNHALNALKTSPNSLKTSQLSEEQKGTLHLEQAIQLISQSPTAALKKLESYLIQYKDHPGRALALEKVSLLYFKYGSKKNKTEKLLQTYQQYQSLDESEQSFESLNTMENLLALLRESSEELKLIPSINYPDFLSAKVARLYFKKRQYFDAYRIYNKLQNDTANSEQKAYYQFYQALSGLRIQTREYKERAESILSSLSQKSSPIQSEAISLYCDLLLEEGYPDKVIEILEPYSAKSFKQKLLLARSLALTHGDKNEQKERTEKLFLELLNTENLQSDRRLLLASELITFYESSEQLPKAVDIYFEVVNLKPPFTIDTDTSWELYYKIGDQAINVLESQQSWRAAHAFAQKIAKQGGPQVEQSLNRVNELKLKHMIWE